MHNNCMPFQNQMMPNREYLKSQQKSVNMAVLVLLLYEFI